MSEYRWTTRTPVELTPHRCPKCNATGWLGFDPAVGFTANQPFTSNRSQWPCDVCERGILWSRIATTPAAEITAEKPEGR